MRQIGQISEVTCIIIYHSCVSADGRWLRHSTRARYLHVHPGCSSSTDSLHGFPPNLATCCKMACTYMGMLLLAASASAPADGQRFWTSRADPVVSAVNRAAQEAAPPSSATPGGPYGLARTPYMGWRSWNAYHNSVNQTLLESVMEAMVAKQKDGKSLSDLVRCCRTFVPQFVAMLNDIFPRFFNAILRLRFWLHKIVLDVTCMGQYWMSIFRYMPPVNFDHRATLLQSDFLSHLYI